MIDALQIIIKNVVLVFWKFNKISSQVSLMCIMVITFASIFLHGIFLKTLWAKKKLSRETFSPLSSERAWRRCKFNETDRLELLRGRANSSPQDDVIRAKDFLEHNLCDFYVFQCNWSNENQLMTIYDEFYHFLCTRTVEVFFMIMRSLKHSYLSMEMWLMQTNFMSS